MSEKIKKYALKVISNADSRLEWLQEDIDLYPSLYDPLQVSAMVSAFHTQKIIASKFLLMLDKEKREEKKN